MIDTDILKIGGIFGGLLVGLLLVVMILRYLGPLATALKPGHAGNGGSGALMLALQQIATLPAEVKSLTTAINTMMVEVPRKSELMQQFEDNRHDVAAKVMKGYDAVIEKVDDLRTTKKDRRRLKRGKERRRQ